MLTIEVLRDLAQTDDLTLEVIEREIEERKVLLGQLVGWLYPSVLKQEIAELWTFRPLRV
jgi:hypothetical protein